MKLQVIAQIASVLFLPRYVDGKAVFAHYMVGTVRDDTNHAQIDIEQAIATGLDAFALNVGAPTLPFASNTISQLFDAAEGTSFGLFFSFDLAASSDLDAHLALYRQFKDRPNYFKYGPEGRNVLSSYAGGSLGPDAWRGVRESEGVYLIPNVEQDVPEYYGDSNAFFATWGNAVDGVFSWETSWPNTSETPVNTSAVVDEGVKAAADGAGKAYMMGLSSLQYKRCCNSFWYRVGETNLPQRMTQILDLQPEFAEVLTWNDAGESHYIANAWSEGLGEDILQYANSDAIPHVGWQPLIGSFVDAFKRGVGSDGMTPLGGGSVNGAMWYRGILTSCPGEKPPGAGAAIDAVNYAVVLPSGVSGYSVRVSSNGQVLQTDAAKGGLNYNSVAGMTGGSQKVEILDGSGAVISAASSQVDVTEGPVNGFCNFNYYVVGLE